MFPVFMLNVFWNKSCSYALHEIPDQGHLFKLIFEDIV